VVINLLSNAVKFTPDGGYVSVRAEEEDGEVLIEVSDTGMGIPAEDLPNLFQKFFRVHRPGTAIRGTGLGLAITKHIVELQAGTISVRSKENEGSTFTVRFPQQ
jgi:signal transduction histidine kinase